MDPSEDANIHDTPGAIRANPGYALGQLARAFATSQTHPDPEIRARAEQKITTWMKVFQSMLSGALQVGSRTPLMNTPAWATLEVATGGFATGTLLAAGPLQPHEQALLRTLPAVPTGTERAAITSYYLSDAGLEVLRQMLASGCYRIQVPEEGVLLIVTWLLTHGHADQARRLLDTIGPSIAQLRFYPIPATRPLVTTTVVHRQTVGEMTRDLQRLRTSRKIATEREALTVWAPLYDQIVALFAETVAGTMPALQTGADGSPARTPDGRVLIVGGWPCQQYGDDWPERARAALDAYSRLRAAHPLCKKPERPSENVAILRAYLEQCIIDPSQLTGRDVGKIRTILAAINTKRGLPGSVRCQALRRVQRAHVARPTPAELAAVLIARLAPLPQDEGLALLDTVLAPITPDEAPRFKVAAGQPLPPVLAAKLQRCLDAPIETLVTQGVIPSGEVLARVLPQLTMQLHAAGIADPDLGRLYGALYAAFRRRRSLLLLNLEHQVRLDELPWIAAINAFRADELRVHERSRQMLQQIVALALAAFPQQILPNKLLQEIRALAEPRLPIVDEVAADIFMGDFSDKGS
jgi:hypothetical protein